MILGSQGTSLLPLSLVRQDASFLDYVIVAGCSHCQSVRQDTGFLDYVIVAGSSHCSVVRRDTGSSWYQPAPTANLYVRILVS